jgi:hypothetical protein
LKQNIQTGKGYGTSELATKPGSGNITLGVKGLGRVKEKWLLWYNNQGETHADVGGGTTREHL